MILSSESQILAMVKRGEAFVHLQVSEKLDDEKTADAMDQEKKE